MLAGCLLPLCRRYNLHFVHVVWVDGTLNMVKVSCWRTVSFCVHTSGGAALDALRLARSGALASTSQRSPHPGAWPARCYPPTALFATPPPAPLQIQQEKKYGKGHEYAVDLGPLDYVKFAEAFGATGACTACHLQLLHPAAGAAACCQCCRCAAAAAACCRSCSARAAKQTYPFLSVILPWRPGIQINDADEFLPTLEKALEMQVSH